MPTFHYDYFDIWICIVNLFLLLLLVCFLYVINYIINLIRCILFFLDVVSKKKKEKANELKAKNNYLL